MSKTKYTPGPWTWKQRRGNNIYEYVVFKQETGYILAEQDVQVNPELNKANAQLISAAPDLLEAADLALNELGKWQELYQDDHDITVAMSKLYDAILKATGKD